MPVKKESAISKLTAERRDGHAPGRPSCSVGYGFMNSPRSGRFYRDAKVREIWRGDLGGARYTHRQGTGLREVIALMA